MDLYPLFVDRDISACCLGPAAAVEVLNAIPFESSGLMSVAAEDAVCTFYFRMCYRA